MSTPATPIELRSSRSPLTHPGGCPPRFVPERLLFTNDGTSAQTVLCFDTETNGFAVGKASLLWPNLQEDPRAEVEFGVRFADSAFFPNVLAAAEVQFRGRTWFVAFFAYCGQDLFDFIHHHPPMSPLVVRMVFAQALAAVSFMHADGVTHQDLKPENLLVRAGGPDGILVSVCDFGQASTKSYLTGQFGTKAYRAPEQGLTATFNARASDVYSLGMILFVMLSKSLMVEDTPEGFEWRRTASPHAMDVHLQTFRRLDGTPIFDDADVRNLICGMLASNPSNRLTLAHVADHAWMQKLLN